jgi:hypothetical protein
MGKCGVKVTKEPREGTVKHDRYIRCLLYRAHGVFLAPENKLAVAMQPEGSEHILVDFC